VKLIRDLAIHLPPLCEPKATAAKVTSRHRKVTASKWARILGLMFASIVLTTAPRANAIPTLQLDATGGVYNNPVESTSISSDVIDLWALVSGVPASSGTYWVDVAITPQTTSAHNFGSFIFNGTTVNVTSGMTLGNPGLSAHGIYNTYYKEFSFTFNLSHKITPYDVSLGAGQPATHVNSSGTGYYNQFSVDLSGLSENVEVWFDFYHKKTSGAVDAKAPFSHDAFTVSGSGPGTQIPEPTGFVLTGIGLLTLFAVIGRRKA
jgi:hypothetical protein